MSAFTPYRLIWGCLAVIAVAYAVALAVALL